MLIVVLSVKRHSAKYYTNEDKRNGKNTFPYLQSIQFFFVLNNHKNLKQTISIYCFNTNRWAVWEKHRYTFNHRKWIELQISHRWYYLYDWWGVIATIVTATIDIVYNAEWVKSKFESWSHHVMHLLLPLLLVLILLSTIRCALRRKFSM